MSYEISPLKHSRSEVLRAAEIIVMDDSRLSNVSGTIFLAILAIPVIYFYDPDSPN